MSGPVRPWRVVAGRAALVAALLVVPVAALVGTVRWMRAGGDASSPEPRGPVARIAALEAQVAGLRVQTEEERRRRQALEGEIALLRTALAVSADVEARRGSGPEAAPRGASAAPEGAAGEDGNAGGPSASPAGLDADRLVAAGFHREDVERFQTSLDGIELQRLYLRDRAGREGWLGTPRYQQESQRLETAFQELRQEFGDGLYDWALYASGYPNRVAVSEVLSGSAAESVGLRPGDVIERYDERLVLGAGELRDATAQGTTGETVAVDVRRGEQSLRVFVPRGPLGVRLASVAREP
jgi:hypothetical protein